MFGIDRIGSKYSCVLALLSLVVLAGSGGAVGAVEGGEHLRLLLRFEDGAVSVKRVEHRRAAARRAAQDGEGWRVETSDRQGRQLDERVIPDPRKLHVDWIDPAGDGERLAGGVVQLERASFLVDIPVDPALAHRVVLSDERGRVLLDLLVDDYEPYDSTTADGGRGAGTTSGVDACSGGWTSELVVDSGDPANRLNITFLGDGYTSTELDSYALDVQNTIDYLLAREPYAEYRGFINFYQVNVVSNESGVDEPDNGIYKDTALDCAFNWGGTPRCLYCPSEPVFDAADCVPETDEILVVGNTTRYGGCGGAYSVYAGKNSNATDIAFHELGHSFAGLADEYGGSGSWPTIIEYPDPNCSIQDSATMTSNETKWWYWLGDEGISTYYTCGGYGSGLYRPLSDCEMRSLHRTLCAVCEENHILDYYARVDGIDQSSPASDPQIQQIESATFSITRVSPTTHEQEVSWYLDDAVLPGETSDVLVIEGEDVALGDHPVRVEVVDTTPRVRYDPGGLLSSQRSWTLTVSCTGAATEYDTDNDGICEQGLGGRDCDDSNGDVWGPPSQARNLFYEADKQTLTWSAPSDLGGTGNSLVYDTLRSDVAESFDPATCVETNGADTTSLDGTVPLAGSAFFYLVRAENPCPGGVGSPGTSSAGSERSAAACD